MEIIHIKDKGFFVDNSSNEKKEIIAELTYKRDGDMLIADHTFVSEELRGQGVAENLFNEIVSFARENDLKIHAVCSYIVRKFENETYSDIKV
jgi:predicted GNAT family acetyltransferase